MHNRPADRPFPQDAMSPAWACSSKRLYLNPQCLVEFENGARESELAAGDTDAVAIAETEDAGVLIAGTDVGTSILAARVHPVAETTLFTPVYRPQRVV